jgi:hypothetical protein
MKKQEGTIMKMKTLAMLIAAAALVASTSANAIPVNITTSGGADVVAAPKSDLGDFGDATVFSWLASDIITYNSLNSSSLPALLSNADQIKLTSGAGGNSITLNVTGFDYLFFHWGGQGGGWAQAFYIGGSTGSFTFDNSAIGTGRGPSVGGLSFYSFYDDPPTNDVPDGGTTALLLGLAVSGLGLIRRKLS